jgi:RimJ/RimL family protein N-acetyltransferase
MKLINVQPTLSNSIVTIKPLRQSDFEELFKVASDPLIWEQHPEPDRYKKEVFKTYFDGAMESRGAFAVYDSKAGGMIGSSRFHDYNDADSSIVIGYTFLARAYWGTTSNRALKQLMLDYIFHFVDKAIFHVGKENFRSQKAMEKLGAIKTGKELKLNANGSQALNIIYCIDRVLWNRLNGK